MASADGRFVITYNGEIYNFQELRAELEARRPSLQIADRHRGHALRMVGMGRRRASTRFNGMFAFAIWDRARRELLLARDRYGIKPLYYAEAAHALLFGSEIKALLAHPVVRARSSIWKRLLEY